MAAVFFQNGVSIGPAAGWCGYTGSNNYVVRYQFSTGSEGADSVSVSLSGIYYGYGSGSQGFGFKLSTSSVAYANARDIPPDSNYAVMSYSSDSGYGCVLTASGLNLPPDSMYYIFVYLATSGTEYYSGWNCLEPIISCQGSYSPPQGIISSITAQVDTGSSVSLLLSGSPWPWHRASFSHNGELLGNSEPFAASLSHLCPREWLTHDIYAQNIQVNVQVQGYGDELCTKAQGQPATSSFILRADSLMRPVLSEGAVSIEAVNQGEAAAFSDFIAGVSRAKISFDPALISLDNCAGARISSWAVSCKDTRTESTQPEILTDIIHADTLLNCIVVDSRGREGSLTLRVCPKPYVPPTLTETEAQRCDQDGMADPLGEYYIIRASASCTSLSGENSCSVSLRCQSVGGNWSDEISLTGFESGVWSSQWGEKTVLGGGMQGDSYRIELKVTDRLGCASRYILGLYHQRWAVKFNKKGTALGLGMEPTAENALQLPDSWKIYAGAIVLSENSYGYAEPEEAVAEPVQGQLYFLLGE